MSRLIMVVVACLAVPSWADTAARFVQTPYTPQKIVFDFYFSEPSSINAALHWMRSTLNPLQAEPYGIAPDLNDVKVVIHGTEIVAVARKNYEKYSEAVDRMRYYAALGVEFKVCALAAEDFDYEVKDFYEFVDVVPSAITELAHWQLQGYALITPKIIEKRHAIEDIR